MGRSLCAVLRPRGGSGVGCGHHLGLFLEKGSISCHLSKQRMSRSSAIIFTTNSELMSPNGTQEGKSTCYLGNPRDGGAWWAAIYGAAQSRTRPKWLSSSSSHQIFAPSGSSISVTLCRLPNLATPVCLISTIG